MRKKLTPAFVRDVTPTSIQNDEAASDNEKKPGAHVVIWDTAQRGFGLLVLPSGERRYVIQYRAQRRSRRLTLRPGLTLTDARKEAQAVLGAVAKGGDPLAERERQEGAATNTFKAITEEYLKRECGMTRDSNGKPTFNGKLRSAEWRLRVFERLIYPVLGDRQIDSIKRSEIVRLLDKIEDENGPSMAHLVLAFLSRVMNWHAGRNDDFLSPIRRGMGRIKPAEHARERVLTDDELRAVWQAAESTSGPFGHYVRFLLLTAVRRDEAANMTRHEVSNGDWTIPAARMKGKREHIVPLSPTSKAIIDGMPQLGSYVFTTGGKTPIRGYTKFKAKFDAAVLAMRRGQDPETEPLPNWTLHDLRRTARSLMSRAGINADVAERCLAHTIGGVRGVYDRYAYYKEKKHAFEALAAQVERIVHPADNVASLDERRATRKGVSQVPA
jgi:integrase